MNDGQNVEGNGMPDIDLRDINVQDSNSVQDSNNVQDSNVEASNEPEIDVREIEVRERRAAGDWRVAMVGGGSWGTALASVLAERLDVEMWALEPEVVEGINERRENPLFHPGIPLPERLRASSDLGAVVAKADVVVLGTPTQFLRRVVADFAPALPADTPLVSLAKGIEAGTLLRPTQIVAELLPERDPSLVGVLAGPNLASEIMAGLPAASVLAFTDHDLATELQPVFHSERLRVFTNEDVIGCELGGALKNVVALASGMAHGLGFGQNGIGVLLSHGLLEMCRIGAALGARPETFFGLAGQGDLVATCLSESSRNHRVGLELARGRTLREITDHMQMVAEGAKSAAGVVELARRNNVDAPLAELVRSVVEDGRSPQDAFEDFHARHPGHELAGLVHLS
jgi:glycerol-3-phosphate dehydrogenase (NAD(P)+)